MIFELTEEQLAQRLTENRDRLVRGIPIDRDPETGAFLYDEKGKLINPPAETAKTKEVKNVTGN